MQRTIFILVGLLLASGVVFADDYEDGVAAYEKKDYATAFSRFKQAAEQGNADAQLNLGGMYRYGRGVPKEYVMAYIVVESCCRARQCECPDQPRQS